MSAWQCFVIVIIVIIIIVIISETHGLTHCGRAMCTQHNKHSQHTIITQLPRNFHATWNSTHSFHTTHTKLTKCVCDSVCLFVLFGAVVQTIFLEQKEQSISLQH